MRIIAHVDMDAFFAAVEERYNPQFRGKPIVIGADPKQGLGRGVVSTASYAARKYGIRSALPISKAWQFAEEARKRGEPETIFLRGQHGLYTEVSGRIMAILARDAGAFEQASIDEAYLEWKFQITNSKSQIDPWAEAEERAKRLKAKILEAEQLTCSIGVGPNKLIAKVASDFQKPNGLTVVHLSDVEAFLDPLSIRAIPGIGPKGEALLNAEGIRTVRDLRGTELVRLIEWFGKWGEDLYRKARGISESEVSNEGELKSVGEQETFETDTLSSAFILGRARGLADSVFKRFQEEGFRSFRTVVVTVRFADFTTLTRSHTLPHPVGTRESLQGAILRLLLPFLDRRGNPKSKPIRLIGVRVEKISR